MDVDWKTLLSRHRYAVILGEARSGKTYEMWSQAQELLRQQRFAFYAPLTDLNEPGFPFAFSEDQQQAFERWLGSSEEAYFFIDSVDEARQLVNMRLGQAVRQLRQRLGEASSRMRLVLSCRVSDWRPQHDLNELNNCLSLPPRGGPDKSVGIYQLLSLGHHQIEKVVRSELCKNQDDVNLFMEELSRAQIWMFAGRPADLRWLISYWTNHRKFGSFTQIIAENIEQKLKEENPEYIGKKPLSVSRAVIAVQRLAAGLLFGGKTAIALGSAMATMRGSHGEPPRATVCDPEVVLADFQSEEITDLLRRPLFDEATYGRVRFHHRTVMEYLAAKWLSELCQQSLTASELLKVLFVNVNGRRVLPRSRAAVAAWLAPEISELRSSLIKDAPEALLCHADPANLPGPELVKALKNCAVRLQTRRRAYNLIEEGDFALCRLALTPLEEASYEILDKYRTSSDLCIFLLKLIGVAQWKSHCDLIGDLAISDVTEERIRIYAIRSLSELQDSTQIARLVHLAQHSPSISSELRALLSRVLYPQALTIQDCLKLLTPAIGSKVVSSAESVLGYELPNACLDTDRKALLSGLLGIAENIMRSRSRDVLGSSFLWLYRALAKLVIDIADKESTHADTLETIKPALILLTNGVSRGKYHDREGLENFFKRQRSIARDFTLDLYMSKPEWIHLNSAFPQMRRGLFKFEAQDVPWLLAQAKNNKEDFARQLTLFTAISVFFESDLDDGLMAEMESLAGSDPRYLNLIANAKLSKLKSPEHEQEERERQADAKQALARDEAWRSELGVREKKRAQSLLERTQSTNLSADVARGILLDVINQHVRELSKEILTELFDRYRSVVDNVFCELIVQEFCAATSSAPWTLSYVAFMPIKLKQTLAPLVLDQLLNQEPFQVETLKNSLHVILTTPITIHDPRLMSLAPKRAKEASAEHRIWWLATLLCLDGEAAWRLVQERLTTPDMNARFVTDLSVALHTIISNNAFLKEMSTITGKCFWHNPELIGQIVRTLYKNLRTESRDDDDDMRMTTIGPNHHAEEFRDSLTSRLWKIASEHGLRVLASLASDPELSIYRDYFLRLHDLSVADMATEAQSAWSEADIKTFETKSTKSPATAKELFELVRARLDDIRLRIERGADFSIGPTLCKAVNECELQNWLADELDKKKPSYYCVVREGEVADGNNQDIQIVSNSCGDRIAIEIKPTNRPKHSYEYYKKEALKGQLIEKYLRAANARYGILVLIHTKDRTWRKSDRAKTRIPTFVELVNALNAEAVSLAAVDDGFGEVYVCGIDCT